MKLKNIAIFTTGFLIVSLCINCSYVVDSIEAGITERSSFSINGDFSSGLVTISWEKGRVGYGDEAFAGYEIYITEQPDNEFVGYTALIAPYDLGEDIEVEKNLRKTGIDTISFDPEAFGKRGVYFFRVGIIQWDKTTKKERAGTDDDKPETTGWRPLDLTHYFYEYDESNYDENDDNQWFYVNKTSLTKISGSLMVDIK